jgi:hypothetical protein
MFTTCPPPCVSIAATARLEISKNPRRLTPVTAICWVRRDDLTTHDLDARLIGADPLYALCTGADTSPVRAEDTLVLLDADAASWASWNRYAAEFADDTAARVVQIGYLGLDADGVWLPAGDPFRLSLPADSSRGGSREGSITQTARP